MDADLGGKRRLHVFGCFLGVNSKPNSSLGDEAQERTKTKHLPDEKRESFVRARNFSPFCVYDLTFCVSLI